MTEPGVVEVSVHVEAQPETVFSYFTDPARYVQWMGGSATLDPAPGGAYRVGMRDGVQAAGEFVEVEPPHRLVFTWGWTHDLAVAPGSTRVVVTFHEEDGGTRVVLRHYDLPSDEQRDHHSSGWNLYLRRLTVRVAGGDPGPDPNT
ncbi:MAG: SRPBCC domain-containing protein [Mycobacteriales bacterium]